MINLDLKLTNDNIKKVLEEDYIDRNKYINGLINILNSLEESKIIALDGDWGSGKTFFLKSLEYLMNNDYNKKIKKINEENLKQLKQEYMVFYYNAWENDDASSAMLSLIYKLVNDCLKASVLEDVIDTTVSGIGIALNTIIKFATEGLIDVKEDIFGEKWTSKEITDEIITSEEIKQTYRNLINEILSENKNKMLIIIDEIDRCKPTFAIDLLENIKHFYDDDRVVFVVATNNKQLGASVCKVYGEKYDGYAYLDKFFDLNLELPNNYLEKYIKVIDENENSFDYYFNSCREMAKEYKLTMREYNRYLKSINSIEGYLRKSGDLFPYLNITIKHLIIPLVLCLKIKDKEKYYNCINGNSSAELERIIKNNNYFYELAEKICTMYKNDIFKEVTDRDKLTIITNMINEIYINLFTKGLNKNENQWALDLKIEEIMEILTMMN